jgi:hypothetical protein
MPMSQEPAATPEPPPTPPGPRWFRRLSSVLFVIFCFELGLFLIVYPWTTAWDDNYFSQAVPDRALSTWRVLWSNHYVRGAVSGLGLVNIWIAVAEVFRLFASRGEERRRQSHADR